MMVEAGGSCFGTFQPAGSCVECAAAQWCQDFTTRLDMEAIEQEERMAWLEEVSDDILEREMERRAYARDARSEEAGSAVHHG